MVAGQVLGEPTALIETLFARPHNVTGTRLFTGMSLTSVLEQTPDEVDLISFVGMGTNAKLLAQRRLQLVPCHMSELGWSMTRGPLRPDIALVLVSPPDVDGMCSLGAASDYIWPAVSAASTVFAEINPNVPRLPGDTGIPFDRFDAVVESDRPLPDYPRGRPSAIEQTIGKRVAAYVRDGSCIQIGVGKLGDAVLASVADRRDLAVHAGMIGETILELMRDGVVTNACKPIDTGLTVTGSILGGPGAVALAATSPHLQLRSVDYTHDAAVITSIDNFISINSAIEVDLFGQINSEVAGGRYLGGIGGSVDYMRPAVRAAGGRSIVALPATARGGISRVVPAVQRITAARSDVDVVITEYGAAELRGVSEGERAMRLVAVAAPEHRDELRAAVRRLGL
ncbi:acetyl-CoA hydrolase/transferase family protein [Mycolicibacterium sp. CBMA 234]|uniref:acetyl-CoA hydrolase/transferase family protein n=1 Tax=Mycolicibacterium sp. CBMA 234 TaxID=1918495 RepID=UPI001390E067|nr:acetyl-CoA hydrolase/transferase C-terminal domain-containing protein [Mycolicibacterium sp. CBMA 234]